MQRGGVHELESDAATQINRAGLRRLTVRVGGADMLEGFTDTPDGPHLNKLNRG